MTNCPLCEVVHYFTGTNRTNVSAHYMESRISTVDKVWKSMEIQSGHSELSVILQVSEVEGYQLCRVPLYLFL